MRLFLSATITIDPVRIAGYTEAAEKHLGTEAVIVKILYGDSSGGRIAGWIAGWIFVCHVVLEVEHRPVDRRL